MNGIVGMPKCRLIRLFSLGAAIGLGLSGSVFALQVLDIYDRSPVGYDGASFAAVVYAQTQTTAQRQTLCPITGDEVDRSQYVDYEGKRIYFCCAPCKKIFARDPQRYIREMESKGIVLEKVLSAPQPPTNGGAGRTADYGSQTDAPGQTH